MLSLGLAAFGVAAEPGREKGDSMPREIKLVRPDYPEEMKRAGIAGQVVLEFLITTTGGTADIRVVSATNDTFAQAAIRACAASTYTPGRHNGRITNTRVQRSFTFDLTPKPAR
jgi:protein TonB